MDDAKLHTIWQQRQLDDRTVPLAQPITLFVRHQLAKRVRQLNQLAKVWDELVPESISQHSALDSFNRGVLTVIVDTASHRFAIQNLIKGGLTRQLQQRFPGTLNKIKVVPGQFYSVDLVGLKRYEF